MLHVKQPTRGSIRGVHGEDVFIGLQLCPPPPPGGNPGDKRLIVRGLAHPQRGNQRGPSLANRCRIGNRGATWGP